jgi:NADP-dependent 3-hydroxy acid dehydrogenase YdfG
LVVIAGSTKDKLEQGVNKVESKLRVDVVAMAADVSSEKDNRELVQHTSSSFCHLDAVFLNAGATTPRQPFLRMCRWDGTRTSRPLAMSRASL